MTKRAELTTEQESEVRRQLARGVDPKDIAPTRTKAARPGAKRGEMNKLELAYSRHLDSLKETGEILEWKYEAVKLRIAFGEKAAWFTVDFWVRAKDGSHEFHECKGWWREAGRLRIKVAAGIYKWAKFIGIKKRKASEGGGWSSEPF